MTSLVYGSILFDWEVWIFFFNLCRYPGQLARTTTNFTAHWTPCKPSGHVKHRECDRRAHEDSNSWAAKGDKLLPPPNQGPQCMSFFFFVNMSGGISQSICTHQDQSFQILLTTKIGKFTRNYHGISQKIIIMKYSNGFVW